MCSVDAGLRGYKCDPDWIESLRQKDDKKETANRFETRVSLKFVLLPESVERLDVIHWCVVRVFFHELSLGLT